MKSFFKEYGLVLFINGLFLLGIELGFRFYSDHLYQMPSELKGKNFKEATLLMRPTIHPQAGFRYLSNLDVLFLGKQLTTNRSGFRGRELRDSDTEGTFKIGIIGDSVSAGWGVADNEVYSHILEELLNRDCKKKVEVYNLATPGQSATQEYFVLKEFIDYGLDFVIINYVGNDWKDESLQRKRDYIDSPSYALNFIVTNLLAKMSGFQNRPTLEWRPSKAPLEKEIDSLLAAYFAMANILHQREIKAMVLMDSRYEAEDQTHEQMEVIFKNYDLKTINLLKMWHPIPKLSMLDAVKRVDQHNQSYLIPEDFHPNSLWHKDVASILYKSLKQEICTI